MPRSKKLSAPPTPGERFSARLRQLSDPTSNVVGGDPLCDFNLFGTQRLAPPIEEAVDHEVPEPAVGSCQVGAEVVDDRHHNQKPILIVKEAVDHEVHGPIIGPRQATPEADDRYYIVRGVGAQVAYELSVARKANRRPTIIYPDWERGFLRSTTNTWFYHSLTDEIAQFIEKPEKDPYDIRIAPGIPPDHPANKVPFRFPLPKKRRSAGPHLYSSSLEGRRLPGFEGRIGLRDAGILRQQGAPRMSNIIAPSNIRPNRIVLAAPA